MKARDYLWCALHLALDREEELARLCPACRSEAAEERCPACGALRTETAAGQNAVLLAQQEEQEQGEAPELETGPLTVWLEENTRPAEAAAARRGVEQDEAGACAGPGAVIGNRYVPEAPVGDSSGQPSDRGAKQWADGLQTAGTLETAGKMGERTAQPARPEHTAEYRSGSGVAWLDGLVRRSMEREWSGGTERRVVTVEQYGGAVGAPAEAEALDRLFRRDARRYDGGFRLL